MPFRISELHLIGGDSVTTGDADVVVFVGANNTGKSRVLVETMQTLSLEPGRAPHLASMFVLRDVAVELLLNGDEFVDWLAAHRARWVEPSDGHNRYRTIGAGDIFEGSARQWWNPSGRFYQLAQHLVRALFCSDRLGYLAAPGRPSPGAHLEHPVQQLATTPHLFRQFRDAFKTAFKQEVIVDAWGPNVQLRVSAQFKQEDFASGSETGMPPSGLVERLLAVPTIDTQSDGVRSFAGILLTLLTMQYPLVLLDEPEAFLHPPQARLLGRYLSTLPSGGQVFVATHSLDIMLGLIHGRADRVKIVRLSRLNGVTSARALPPAELNRIWTDPLLRFSRVLDGLFHEGVVICEGDSDSQFYAAVADEIQGGELAGPDVMFTFAGSKHRIALVATALRALGVPVTAVADFDVINDRAVLTRMVESLGGTYSAELEAKRALVDSGLRGSQARVTRSSAAELLDAALAGPDDYELTPSKVKEIRGLLEPETGWRAAKKAGAAVVPPGGASVALSELLEELARFGLFVVPSGAVESFVRAVPSTGPQWVVEVLEGGHLGTADEAKKFVRRVLTFLTP